MLKDRITNGALKAGIAAAKSTNDTRIAKLTDSQINQLVETIVDYHVVCITDEMLSGETRSIIPKIGSFTRKANKAILTGIQKSVLQERGYKCWSDVPYSERASVRADVNAISMAKFKQIKHDKRNNAVNIANSVKSAIENKCEKK